MSIITKEKTTAKYLTRLESIPESTRKNKRIAATKFQEFCKKQHKMTPDALCKELLIMKKQNEQEYTDTLYDILQEWIIDSSKKINPNSLRTEFSGVRAYIYYFGIKTDPQDIKHLLLFPRIPREEKHPLKHTELFKIINDQSRNLVRKALYLACSSSGMRIGEAVQIRKSDLEFKERSQINIRPEYTKTQTGRSVFISKKCQDVLEEYLENLESGDIIFFKGKSKNPKIRASNEARRLRECLDRIGLDKKYGSSKKYKISSHSFRAFFFTQAVRKHGENYAHRLTGHGGYLMQYDRMTDEEKLKMYIELESELVVFDISKQDLEIEKLKIQQNKEIKEMKEQMQSLQSQLAKQGMEILKKLQQNGKM